MVRYIVVYNKSIVLAAPRISETSDISGLFSKGRFPRHSTTTVQQRRDDELVYYRSQGLKAIIELIF